MRRDALRDAGADLVDLTESNPAACGLSPDMDAVAAAIAAGARRPYSPDPRGLPHAREALAAYLGRRGTPVDPAHLVLTASTSEAYAWLIKLLCDPWDAVLVPQPCYPLFEWLARMEGVHLVPYALSRADGFRVHADSLPVDSRVRAVLAVSPGNPTGTFLKQDELEALEVRCAREGWALVMDEVFSDYGRGADDSRVRTVAGRAGPALNFALSGLSKVVGLAGLKLGWMAVGGPEALRDAALARLELIADTYLSVNTPVQEALGSLLAQADGFQAQVRARVEANLATLHAARTRDAGWNVLPVEGGWSAVLRIPRHPGELETALAALEEGVVVYPGHFFDFPPGADFLVLSLLPEEARFAEGVARLTRVL
ncbi:MAG: pyridoxal phosphate-dependent aminotransferase [Myxococcaceae bacterium]|nr:pyridoxal phosphate-dependent aminotransferase [Myxococcaceae bacterium]MCI0669252.1 pyridoxal phosphate-dependent aminotransferase [Myxococcaceae bacterium]